MKQRVHGIIVGQYVADLGRQRVEGDQVWGQFGLPTPLAHLLVEVLPLEPAQRLLEELVRLVLVVGLPREVRLAGQEADGDIYVQMAGNNKILCLILG